MPARFRFFLRYFLSLIGVFLMGKAVFMLCNPPAEHAAAWTDAPAVMWHGLPLDLATAGYLSAVPWLVMLLSFWVKIPRARLLFKIYAGLVATLLAVILTADCCLYGFWGFKLDGTVFNYMDSPKGMTASVSTLYIIGVAAAIVLSAFLIFALLCGKSPAALRFPGRKKHDAVSVCKSRRSALPESLPALRGWRLRSAMTAVGILTGGLLFLGIRGGVGKSTANVGMVYYSQNQYLNHSAVNPAFSIFYSLFKTRDFARQHEYYGEAERARIFASLGYSTESVGTDTLLNTRRPNVLVILMEGCGGTFVNAVDPEADANITPRLNALAGEGVVFTGCYANSFRTDRGTVCALSGYPSFPDVSVMKLPGKYTRLPGIAASLRRAGYSTEFLYGGDINFTNTNGYLMATGYDRTYGDTSFPASVRHTHDWGVTDSIVFDRLFDMVTAYPADRPWHTAVLTLASHEPWGVPYDRIKGDPEANSMAYLDACIGRFTDRLRATPQWRNTLIVILPDHGIGYPAGLSPHQPRRAHIPLIWTGGAVREARVIDRLCNQTDLPATLLGQLGLPHTDFRWSRDVLSRTYTHPSAVHTWSEGIWYKDTTGVSVINLVTRPQSVISETPAPSPARRAAANALLQTAYDDLGAL